MKLEAYFGNPWLYYQVKIGATSEIYVKHASALQNFSAPPRGISRLASSGFLGFWLRNGDCLRHGSRLFKPYALMVRVSRPN